MKKTLLAIVMLPAMFAAGAANAAFVISPENDFNGSLDFNGTITNSASNWSWEIPAASAASAKDWTVEKISGITKGDNLKFDFASKGNIPFLQGVMTAPVSGIPGYHRSITGAGKLFEAGTDGMAIQVVANGTKSGTAVADGTFDAKFNIGSALTGFFAYGSEQALSNNNAFAGVLGAKAFTYLSDAVAKFAAQYPNIDMSTATEFPGTDTDRLLSYAGEPNPVGSVLALSSDLSNMSIAFPKASIPDTWNASVPIVITMK